MAQSVSFVLRLAYFIELMSFSKTNLSCLLYGPGQARFENRPVPQIEDPHDVLIRISYVGVCGSDVSPPRSGEINTQALTLLKRCISGYTGV